MGEDGREEEKGECERGWEGGGKKEVREEKGECERKDGRRWDGEGKRGV